MIVSRLLSPVLKLRPITNLVTARQLTMARQVQDDSKFTGVRLPTNVKPVHYDLHLKPNFEDFTFAGKVSIAYKANSVADLTNSVVLHASELEITDGSVKSSEAGSAENRLNTVTYSKTSETATLEFNDTVASDGVISLVFTGCLNDKMKGFYRTSFDIGETKVYAATTQFESTDARLAFPCWDEPALKATFTVTLVIDKYMNVEGKQYERVALSNMPEVSRSGPDNEVEVKFDKSPIMSTYLLAFIIGPFEALEGSDTRRQVRVFTTPNKTSHGQFALDVACKALPYYEDYFGVKYPLPKMDLVAIPDFTSGAMENWGLVTYRETCLLVDPNNTATAVKQYVAIVVAHELAHQWFGNLVTMEWWTHLWLNEGFATFMEYLCVDYIFPEWSIFSQFLSDCYNAALSTDALDNSHAIEIPVNNPSEISEIFDHISYQKGASVIRMLYTYIGDDDFRKGMKDYLTKFAYKNATTEDLWDSLEAASCKPIRKLMSGWTSQKGFPWLAVECSQDGDKTKLTLTQNKFSANGQVPAGDAHSMWVVPVSAIIGSDPSKQVQLCLLDAKTKEVTIDGLGSDWLKLNPGMIGLYRVVYPEELSKRLHSAVLNQSLPPMDRLGLQSDAYALCKAGMLGSVELLQLLQSYKEETELAVWRSIDDCLGRFSALISGLDYQDNYFAFGRQLLTEISKKLTWVPQGGESDQTAMTRGLVLNRLVAFQDDSVLKEAKRLYKQHVAGVSNIPADLRNAVYRAVSVFGDDEAFDNLFNIWKTTELSEEKNRVARALGFTKNENRLSRVVDFVLSDAVRNQDKIYFLLSIGASSPSVAWKLFKDNKEQLREKFGSGHLMSSIVEVATKNFTTEEMAKEIEDYFSANKVPGAERTVQQSVENVRLNASWLARDGKKMMEYLQKFH